MSFAINEELQNKIDSFIEEEGVSNKRPLGKIEVQETIVQLRTAGISFGKITEFIKKEFNIKVTVQAVSQKYKSLNKEGAINL